MDFARRLEFQITRKHNVSEYASVSSSGKGKDTPNLLDPVIGVNSF
jgi:hypothetical protein